MVDRILNFPDYCNFHKNLLVEELYFLKSPLHLHYGKCAVIGKLFEEDHKYYLQNICLRALDKQYQIKTGTLKILLLEANKTHQFVNGVCAEVFGETVFCSKATKYEEFVNELPKTSKDLLISLRMMHGSFKEGEDVASGTQTAPISDTDLNKDAIERDLRKFTENYQVAIRVNEMNVVNQAEELLALNLGMRKVFQNPNRIQNNYK